MLEVQTPFPQISHFAMVLNPVDVAFEMARYAVFLGMRVDLDRSAVSFRTGLRILRFGKFPTSDDPDRPISPTEALAEFDSLGGGPGIDLASTLSILRSQDELPDALRGPRNLITDVVLADGNGTHLLYVAWDEIEQQFVPQLTWGDSGDLCAHDLLVYINE
jgi:hypothetical protein